ncbi:MAG: siderophore-interacting protein [Actinoplanes sp.]
MFKVRRPGSRRMISLEVLSNTPISPGFTRLTLAGDDLEHLEDSGYDQCVRVFFPRDGQDGLQMPTLHNDAWMAQTLILPKARRPWVRNYTVRAFRPEKLEVDIEIALHGDAGPGSSWAPRARPGDPAGIFDEGISYLPFDGADWQLLVGDESAVPAVLAILERSPDSLTAEVFLEVAQTADIRTRVTAPPGVRVHWLARDGGGAAPGMLALEAVRQATLPPGRFYTWAAGESKLPTGLRRHLVGDRGVAKADIAFIGYWRAGRSSPG